MEQSLAIIGAGRVGRALGRRLRELGWKIGVVVTRSEASSRRAVRFIGAGKAHAGLTSSQSSPASMWGPNENICHAKIPAMIAAMLTAMLVATLTAVLAAC